MGADEKTAQRWEKDLNGRMCSDAKGFFCLVVPICFGFFFFLITRWDKSKPNLFRSSMFLLPPPCSAPITKIFYFYVIYYLLFHRFLRIHFFFFLIFNLMIYDCRMACIAQCYCYSRKTLLRHWFKLWWGSFIFLFFKKEIME